MIEVLVNRPDRDVLGVGTQEVGWKRERSGLVIKPSE